MESQPVQRCPHYQLHSELLAQDGPPAYLAIRHCVLTARMLQLMQAVPEAEPLALRLTMRTETRAFACVGPDLDAVTQHLCSFARCDQSCTPAYREMLEQFNIVDPREDEVTCDDKEEAIKTGQNAGGEARNNRLHLLNLRVFGIPNILRRKYVKNCSRRRNI